MLPNVPEKGDVSNWLAAGGTREALKALVAAMPEWSSEEAKVEEPAGTGTDTPERAKGEPSVEDFFGADGRFVPARLGARLIEECPIRLGHDRHLWRYV